jgi:predicted ribosome quality control (RQC) complex YloA/Tae2 family protein
MQYSAVNLHQWLVKHKTLIDTARISQVYRQGPNQVILTLHTKEGKKHILLMIPEFALLLDDKPMAPHKDTGFGRWMRNNVKGCIIDTIEQITSERILKIQLRKGYTIYIEFFNKGNLIVCDENKIIIMALQKIITKDRALAKGETYVLPESFDTFNASEEQIIKEMRDVDQDTTTSKFLASNMHLGGVVAKQICKSIDIDPNDLVKELVPKVAEMKEAIHTIVNQPLETEAIEKEFVGKLSDKAQEGSNKKIKKIENILTQQKKTIKKNDEQIAENTKFGEFIYNNYQFFQELIDAYTKNVIDETVIEELTKKHNIRENVTYERPDINVEL